VIHPRRALLSVVVVLVSVACGQAPPPPPQGISNHDLGIRLASIPKELTVAVNEADQLELTPSADSVEGRMWFSVGPEDRTINLVAAVKRHQSRIEEMPQADYRGGQELATHLGTAFYSRGQFLAGTTETEETAIFIQHPSENRLLTISYRYPVGVDSSVRVEQLLAVLGEIEGITTEP
jgi:hypothetical protein